MPFYEYECQSCKFYTEVMQKITDAPLTTCPSCGKKALQKLVSAPVFRLKGGGWYETDFKSDKENKRNLVGADKDEPKAESKSDSKPETQTDAKDAKGAKDAKDAKPDAKATEAKPAEAKSAEARSAGSSARRSGRTVAKPAARAKAKKARSSRKGRR